MKFLAIYPEKIEFTDGLLISLVAILIVFAILTLIILCVLLCRVKPNNNAEEAKPAPVVSAPKAVVKNTEIKDEDMMVAALIATIDFTSETKEDARLVSIKQIG